MTSLPDHSLCAFLLCLCLCACSSTPQTPPVQSKPPAPPVVVQRPPAPLPGVVLQSVDNAVEQARTEAAREHEKRVAQQPAPEEAVVEAAPKSLGKVVMIGDSMAWLLGQAMKPMLVGKVREFRFTHEISESLQTWQWTGLKRLRQTLRRHNPDTVFIVMGTNDFRHPNVEKLVKTIAKAEALIYPRPCYWVGPPTLWDEDTGIVQLLVAHTKHCIFLDSEPLNIARGRDGWHPSSKGAEQWGHEVLRWIEANPPKVISDP